MAGNGRRLAREVMIAGASVPKDLFESELAKGTAVIGVHSCLSLRYSLHRKNRDRHWWPFLGAMP